MNVLNIIKGYTRTSISALPFSDFQGSTKKRWDTFNKVIGPILSRYKNPKILDAALGSGQDSIHLIKQGYWVISNEIDSEFIRQAKELAKKEKVPLNIRSVKWIDLINSTQYRGEEFDVIFCIGNSFPTYLLEEEERIKSLLGFWRILKPGGTFIFDTRNYDYMLNNAEEILEDPEKNFSYSYKTTYLGEVVKTFPIYITSERWRAYTKHYKNKNYAESEAYPATQRKTRELIIKTLGEVELEVYYDWEEEKPEHYDFVQYVLKKV